MASSKKNPHRCLDTKYSGGCIRSILGQHVEERTDIESTMLARWRPSRRRFSDLLAWPMRVRRSSYAAPESQSSETSTTSESENQEESSPTVETSPTDEEPPVPASRPLSLSPQSIDVLGTLLRCALSSPCIDLLADRKHGIVLKRRHRRDGRIACFRFF